MDIRTKDSEEISFVVDPADNSLGDYETAVRNFKFQMHESYFVQFNKEIKEEQLIYSKKIKYLDGCNVREVPSTVIGILFSDMKVKCVCGDKIFFYNYAEHIYGGEHIQAFFNHITFLKASRESEERRETREKEEKEKEKEEKEKKEESLCRFSDFGYYEIKSETACTPLILLRTSPYHFFLKILRQKNRTKQEEIDKNGISIEECVFFVSNEGSSFMKKISMKVIEASSLKKEDIKCEFSFGFGSFGTFQDCMKKGDIVINVYSPKITDDMPAHEFKYDCNQKEYERSYIQKLNLTHDHHFL